MEEIQSRAGLCLRVYATGAHLSPEFGASVDAFASDGLTVDERIESLFSSDSPAGIAKSMAAGTNGFAQSFSRTRPDILVVLGDRFDVHASVVAALPFKIPVAHIHGGEVTEGAFDEALRHAITKMSHLHFVSTEASAERVRQMGEEDWRVTLSGAPGLDRILKGPPVARREVAGRFGLDPSRPTLLVTFHPVTLFYEKTKHHIESLLQALEQVGHQVLFTYPNADTAGRAIIERINVFCEAHVDARVVIDAGQDWYIRLLEYVDAMVGNSSSGIIESGSFALPVVNIGIRQRGRIRGPNVVDCDHCAVAITAAIEEVLDPSFRQGFAGMVNPYGDGEASSRIVDVLKEVALDERLLLKRFIDLGA